MMVIAQIGISNYITTQLLDWNYEEKTERGIHIELHLFNTSRIYRRANPARILSIQG